MSGCRTKEEDLTAWLDGELPEHQARRMHEHVEACQRCAAITRRLGPTVAMQRHALPQAITIDDVDGDRLWWGVRNAIVDVAPPGHGWKGWLRWPFAVTSLATAMALILLVVIGDGPPAVLLPLGIGTPPVEIVERPDLFKDYPLIVELDALENFDTVQTISLEDEQPSQNG